MATLFDGLATTLNIGGTVLICEIEVTPPAIDGGEGIPQDCMRSGGWNIMWPKKRRKLGPISALVSWSPDMYWVNLGQLPPPNVSVLVNIVSLVTVTFPTEGILTFWGFLSKFEPQAMKEGERPTANITIVPSLINPSTGLVAFPIMSGLRLPTTTNTLVGGVITGAGLGIIPPAQ